MKPAECATLAIRIRDGDRSSEDALCRTFGPRVIAMATNRLGDPETARDIAQETLVRVLEALRDGAVRNPESLAGFVRGTALNLVHDQIRRRGRRPDTAELDPDHPATRAVDPVEIAEQLDLVRRALARLDAVDRRILALTLVEGLKPKAIAERLSMGSDLVRQRKSRARRAIVEFVRNASRTERSSD